MKFTELKDDIKNGARPIYLIEGEDAYFRLKAEEQILTAFSEMPELNFSSYDGSQYKGANLTDIVSAVMSYPFMTEKRIVKVTDFYPSEADYEKYLKPTFENMPETAILIIVNAASGKGAELKRKKCVAYIDCGKADEEAVTKWAYITLKRAGVTADVEACSAIAAYCLFDMARVASETEKLIALKKGERLTRAEVDDLVYKDADYRIYEMTDAVSRKNYAKFAEISADLLTKGFDENAQIAALSSYFRKLLITLTSDGGDASLAKAMKMKEYGVTKNRERARAIGRERLLSITDGLYELSASVKNGTITPAGAYASAVAKLLFV